eukprot:4589075-Prymnesium_polylepis.2
MHVRACDRVPTPTAAGARRPSARGVHSSGPTPFPHRHHSPPLPPTITSPTQRAPDNMRTTQAHVTLSHGTPRPPPAGAAGCMRSATTLGKRIHKKSQPQNVVVELSAASQSQDA